MSLWWRTANGRPLPKSRFTPNGCECNSYEINLKQRMRCAVVITTECCNRMSLLLLAWGALRKRSPPSGWMRDSWTRERCSSREQSFRGKSRTKRWTLWDPRCGVWPQCPATIINPTRQLKVSFLLWQSERKVRLNEIIRKNSKHAALVLVWVLTVIPLTITGCWSICNSYTKHNLIILESHKSFMFKM